MIGHDQLFFPAFEKKTPEIPQRFWRIRNQRKSNKGGVEARAHARLREWQTRLAYMSEWAAVKVCAWSMRRAVRPGRQSGVRRRSARPVRISFSCLHEYQLPVPGGGAAGRARSLAQRAERRGGGGRWPGCWERCRGPRPRPLMVDARGARRSATAMRRPLDLCAGGRRCGGFGALETLEFFNSEGRIRHRILHALLPWFYHGGGGF